jgi:competence protein ComFC
MKKFASEFEYPNTITSIAIDDHIQSGYSHTAILNKALSSKSITPKFNILRANNRVSYSGKSREFRLLNPREFKLKEFKTNEAILIDDIITTGSTLTQAVQVMHSSKKEVLFCLTLADAGI